MDQRYLDVASGWPLRPDARTALLDALDLLGGADPGRSHTAGRRAAQLQDAATATVAELLGAADDAVVWTSGGTEAANLAVVGSVRAARRAGVARRGVVVGAVEHSSVLEPARWLAAQGLVELHEVPVDHAGRVDAERAASVIDDDTLVVHLQHANHEVGTLQPTHEVSVRCRQVGALLHVDACQTVGQLGVTLEQLGADLVSVSGAKFGGPVGTGALLLGPRARVDALQLGDDRQSRRRAGRVPVASVAATAVALADAVDHLDRDRSARELVRRHLRARLAERIDDLAVHGPLAEAHPGIVAASALYVAGDALVARLDDRGWSVASGSSCAVRSGEPSHVLVAMEALTHGHVRASFGPWTDVETIDRFVEDLAEVVTELRAAGRRARST